MENFVYAIVGWEDGYEPPRNDQKNIACALPFVKLAARGYGHAFSEQFREIQARAGKRVSAVVATQTRLLQIAGDLPKGHRGMILNSKLEPVTDDIRLSVLCGLPAADVKLGIEVLLGVGFIEKKQLTQDQSTIIDDNRRNPPSTEYNETEYNEDLTKTQCNPDERERECKGEGKPGALPPAAPVGAVSSSGSNSGVSVSVRPSDSENWLKAFHESKDVWGLVALSHAYIADLYVSNKAYNTDQGKKDIASIKGDCEKLGALFANQSFDVQKREFIRFIQIANEKHGQGDNPIALLRSAWRRIWKLGDKHAA